MTGPVKIQLSVEEALSYQQFDARLSGYLAGIQDGSQSLANHMRRSKIDELMASRKAPVPPAEQTSPEQLQETV